MMLTKRKSITPAVFFLAQCMKFLLIACLILVAIFGFNRFKLSHYFPIKIVQLYGINRADHAQVQQLLLPLVDKGFFTVNVDYIRDRLLQMPWVASVYVRRHWPDQIKINVVEKDAAALWNNDGLLSTSGELFSPPVKTYPISLPHFIGSEGQQILMLQYYRAMNHLLFPIHAKIVTLELTPYLTWKLTLDNGIVIEVGHQAVLNRLLQFVKVYSQVVGARAKKVDYIDLRYANGMAVRWKQS